MGTREHGAQILLKPPLLGYVTELDPRSVAELEALRASASAAGVE